MPKVLTDGKTMIGAYMLPGRKKPCLCIEEGVNIAAYGHFISIESANDFMDKLGQLVNAQKEGADNG